MAYYKDPNHKDRRGGAREGAGRKKLFSKKITVTAPKEMAEYLETKENKSDFIKQCIEKEREREACLIRELSEPLQTAQGVFMPIASVPVIDMPYAEGTVAAGPPTWIDNQATMSQVDVISLLCKKRERCVIFKVEGHSMIDDDVNPGDIVAIDTWERDVPESKVALCRLNGSFTIKHVHRNDDGSIMLMPRNATYTPIPVKPEDEFYVDGMVVGLIKPM